MQVSWLRGLWTFLFHPAIFWKLVFGKFPQPKLDPKLVTDESDVRNWLDLSKRASQARCLQIELRMWLFFTASILIVLGFTFLPLFF